MAADFNLVFIVQANEQKHSLDFNVDDSAK